MTSRSLLAQYREVAVPRSGRAFQKRASWYGTGQEIDDWHVRRHIEKKAPYGVQWSLGKIYNFAVIDIDLDDERDFGDLAGRYLRVFRALKGLPHQVLRSSGSWSWHIYVFLDRGWPGKELRKILCDALVAQGIEIKAGKCEVWPANNNLRLPLGPGSFLLDVACTGDAVTWEVMFLVRTVAVRGRPFPSITVDRDKTLAEFVRLAHRRIDLNQIRVTQATGSQSPKRRKPKKKRSKPKKLGTKRKRLPTYLPDAVHLAAAAEDVVSLHA